MAVSKAGETNESDDIAYQWELLDYIDAGPNWKATSQLYCECDRQLRYQYIVFNNETGERKKFGITHFVEHTGIPPSLANKIQRGVEKIDYELDEILLKTSNNWNLTDEGISNLPTDMQLPSDIQDQLHLKLPLLDRQVVRLKGLLKKQQAEEKKKQKVRTRNELIEMRGEIANSNWWLGIRDNNVDFQIDLQLGVVTSIKMSEKNIVFVDDICNDLVNYHNAPREFYSTGRYTIYSSVSLFLEELVNQGRLERIKSNRHNDRSYKINDPYLLKRDIS